MSEERDVLTETTSSGLSRRTLVKGAAWAVPAVAVAASVPIASASPVKGIAGWVNNSLNNSCTTWTVTSTPTDAGCPTPDNFGCAWGLYTQGVTSVSQIASATFTEYFKATNQTTKAGLVWTTTGTCWGGPVEGSNVQLSGVTGWWTPYTWTYNLSGSGCAPTSSCNLGCSCTPSSSPWFCFGSFNAKATLKSSGPVNAYTERTMVLSSGTVLQFKRPLTLSCDTNRGLRAQTVQPEGTASSDASSSGVSAAS